MASIRVVANATIVKQDKDGKSMLIEPGTPFEINSVEGETLIERGFAEIYVTPKAVKEEAAA